MRRTIFFLLTIFTTISLELSAQYQAAWRSDNYAGINSIFLNPANPVTFPLQWDVNLGEAGFFLDNNYGYIRNTSVLDIYRRRKNINFVFGPDVESGTELSANSLVLDFDRQAKRRFFALSARILGPSFLIKLNKNHHLGLFIGARTVLGSQDIPAALNYYPFDEQAFFTPFEITPFQGAALSWSEVGVNYSYKKSYVLGELGIGISIKALRGFEAAYLVSEEPFHLTKLRNDSFSFDRLVSRYGLTESALENYPEVKPEVNGRGWAFDIGAVYTHEEYDDDQKPYDFKLGFSLLDIGKIHFYKNAENHYVSQNQTRGITLDSYEEYSEVEDADNILRQFSQDMLGDSLASMHGNTFDIWLPGAISIQGDYAFGNDFFLAAHVIQQLPVKPAIKTGNFFSVTPRYEQRWLGVAFPVSSYNWSDFRFGVVLRLGYLVIGTENLGSIITTHHFTGTEAFIALKFNPFSTGSGLPVLRPKRKRGKVKCYDF